MDSVESVAGVDSNKEVEDVWNDNLEKINNVIGQCIHIYKLEENFMYEAQNIFFLNFEKKYLGDDNLYLAYFCKSVYNKAKNICNKRRVESKLFSTILDANGKHVDIFNIVEDTKSSMLDEIFFNEVESWLKDNLDEFEYFVYENIMEGFSLKDIAFFLDCNDAVVIKSRKKVGSVLEHLYTSDGLPLLT